MAHQKLIFEMPCCSADVFDAFHWHQWRSRWDSLVAKTSVDNGAPHPRVGAVSSNSGAGWMKSLSMRTQFITYEPGRIAAASMTDPSFPFSTWAASMRHQDLPDGRSLLFYTYTFKTSPSWLRPAFEPIVEAIFLYQTRKRFKRLSTFLTLHGQDIHDWRIQLRSTSNIAPSPL